MSYRSRLYGALAGICALAALIAPNLGLAQVGGGVSTPGGVQTNSFSVGAWGGAPAYSSGCGGSATFGAGSNNTFGTITYGASASSCVITWGTQRQYTPLCFAISQSALGTTWTAQGTTTGLTVTNGTAGTPTVGYLCLGS